MKVQKANCGASVKAAQGGLMSVKKTGYSTGGMAEKKVTRKTDMKDKEQVEASKGKYVKKKVTKMKDGGTAMRTCAGCPTPDQCAAIGRCKKSGNKLK